MLRYAVLVADELHYKPVIVGNVEEARTYAREMARAVGANVRLIPIPLTGAYWVPEVREGDICAPAPEGV